MSVIFVRLMVACGIGSIRGLQFLELDFDKIEWHFLSLLPVLVVYFRGSSLSLSSLLRFYLSCMRICLVLSGGRIVYVHPCSIVCSYY